MSTATGATPPMASGRLVVEPASLSSTTRTTIVRSARATKVWLVVAPAVLATVPSPKSHS